MKKIREKTITIIDLVNCTSVLREAAKKILHNSQGVNGLVISGGAFLRLPYIHMKLQLRSLSALQTELHRNLNYHPI